MSDATDSIRPPVLGPQIIGKIGGHTHRWSFLRQEDAPPDKAFDVFFCQICLNYERVVVWTGWKSAG